MTTKKINLPAAGEAKLNIRKNVPAVSDHILDQAMERSSEIPFP